MRRPLRSPAQVEGTQGVLPQPENLEAIDAQLASTSDNWAIERIPVADRAILRIAVYEMLPDLAVLPREKPHPGAAAREPPRASPVIMEMRAFVSCMA